MTFQPIVHKDRHRDAEILCMLHEILIIRTWGQGHLNVIERIASFRPTYGVLAVLQNSYAETSANSGTDLSRVDCQAQPPGLGKIDVTRASLARILDLWTTSHLGRHNPVEFGTIKRGWKAHPELYHQ